MTVKVVLAVLSCALAVLFSIQQSRTNQEIKERAGRGRVPVAVEDAKAKNQSEVTLPAPIPWYAAVRNLDDALARFTTVIAQPVQQVSQLTSDGKEVQTWYKAQVIDFLSQPAKSECVSCSKVISVPSQLQPIQPSEIVFEKNGGSVVVDGVKIISFDPHFPDLQIGQKYLMFISFDPFTRVASLKLGPTGISTIESDGRINAISVGGKKLHGELNRRYGTIEKITQELKFRRFTE